MALFNIFGKKGGSENNSAESHASEIAELRAKLARAEQERDALAREKNSLTQKVESLAQENQSLTQDKESLAQQVETLKKEYEPLKKSVDFIQETVSGWPKTIAEILNTAKKEGFNDDPLAHKDVAAIINDINGHLVTWLTGYAEHVRRFNSGSHSKGPGNGSEKIDEASLGKALEKFHESLTAETDAAASENPAPAAEACQQPDRKKQRAAERFGYARARDRRGQHQRRKQRRIEL